MTTLQIHPALKDFKRPSDHSKYSPSAADRWMACPASIALSEGIPQEDSFYSKEGTLAHTVCEATFDFEVHGIPFNSKLLMDMALWDREHGVKSSTDEMRDCAAVYVDCLQFWLNNKEQIGDVLWYGLEKGVPIFPEKGCFGTGDCIIVGSKATAIIDYKHGKGKNVQADSLQLRVYAAGVIRHLGNIPADYGVYSVVVQPRTDVAPKSHYYPVAQINQFLGDIWRAIIASEEKDLAPCDGHHCFWCPAKRTTDLSRKCPVIMDVPVKAAKENFEKYLADMSAPIEKFGAPNPKRDQAMMKILSIAPLIAQIAEDAKEEFKDRLLHGEAIEGLQIFDKVGNRTFGEMEPEAVAEMLRQKFPKINPMRTIPAKEVLRTITDIEKEVGKGALDTVTQRKITKDVRILDDKVREVLGNLAAYGNLVSPKEIA